MSEFEEREAVVLLNHGQKIFGILHKPKVKAPMPVVLMCHGLGGHKTGKFRLYVLLAEKLAKAGIASLRIDFRGSGDSEGHFSDMTINGEVSDALVGLDYLERLPFIDKQRIGIFGRSIGGTVAIMAAAKCPSIHSIAVWAPLYDGHQWRDKWHLLHASELSEEHKTEMMRINGQVPGYPFFHELFEIRMEDHLKHIAQIPLLNLHGEKDDVVDCRHAQKFKEYRSHSSATSKFVLYPNSDHDFSNLKEQAKALDETCDWYCQTLCRGRHAELSTTHKTR